VSEQEGRRRSAPAWIVFTILRILAFAVPLVVAYALGANLVLAAVIAAIVGLCISVIFLSGQRRAFSGELAALRVRPEPARAPDTGEDELAEDAAIDSAAAQNGSASAAASPNP
jgi:uncharacterized protein (DUF58 family)